jgi:hypothetical protein
MLGDILAGLTDAARAEGAAAAIAPAALLARITRAASEDGVPVGALIAEKVRQVVEHGGEALWLDLLGAMSGSPRPGATAAERVLAAAFPDPVRVRVTRQPA